MVKHAPVEVPPEARKPCPELTPKPTSDLSDEQVLENWASDRTARNVCETRRAAAVAAADAAGVAR
ncbi:hypothetical protein F4V91_13430 [Neorhizobium galegae]|uniref:Uncharacterized protein n=1 Tax=Neorhizobium galegae TaxID=399 RepID=A0A6A1TYB1_NEOGA|nr:hypothetical protein F4V91_13430 [Neorhizobium galegae]